MRTMDGHKKLILLAGFVLYLITGTAMAQTTATEYPVATTDSIVAEKDTAATPQPRRGIKWEGPKEEKIPFLAGFAVSTDLVGWVMMASGSTFSQVEIAGRLNLKERVFPLVELGIGTGDREGNSKDNVFHTSAPYFRVGFDVNANKKRTSNRLMVGFRLGFCSFDYDYTGPSLKDPVWGENIPMEMHDMNVKAVWGELSLGFETKIWSFIRLGWNARYKFRFSQKTYEFGEPWYIPGYGPNGTNCWGGTVNLIFDFGKTMKHGR